MNGSKNSAIALAFEKASLSFAELTTTQPILVKGGYFSVRLTCTSC
jgi:hypothetical protein